MNSEKLINLIRQFVSLDDLDNAIEHLRILLLNSPKLDDAIMQAARHSEIKKEIRRGTISSNSAARRKNQIRKAILDTLLEVHETTIENKDIREELKNIKYNVVEKASNLYIFFTWLKKGSGKKVLTTLSVLAATYLINIILPIFWKKWKEYFELVSVLVQLVFITYSLKVALKYKKFRVQDLENKEVNSSERPIWQKLRMFRPGQNPPKDEEEKQKQWINYKAGSNKALGQFSLFWRLLWISWFGLYSFFLFEKVFNLDGDSMFFLMSRTFLNNVNTLVTIFLFLTITISTSLIKTTEWLWWCLIVVIYTYIEIFLIGLFRDFQNQIVFWIEFASSIIAGISLMAFWGRLSSKFLDIPIVILLAFYFYVIIQLIFPFMSYSEIRLINGKNDKYNLFLNTEYLKSIAFFFALVIKGLFLIVVSWLLQTGRMLYFIVEESSLNFAKSDTFDDFINGASLEETE